MQKISCEKTILKTGKPAADNAAYNDDNNNSNNKDYNNECNNQFKQTVTKLPKFYKGWWVLRKLKMTKTVLSLQMFCEKKSLP